MLTSLYVLGAEHIMVVFVVREFPVQYVRIMTDRTDLFFKETSRSIVITLYPTYSDVMELNSSESCVRIEYCTVQTVTVLFRFHFLAEISVLFLRFHTRNFRTVSVQK